MPYTVTIPIINNTDCTQSYTVDYKKSTSSEWIRLTPNPVGDSIVIQNLDSTSTYNIRAVKTCCDGQYSTQATIDITTGA